MTGTRAATLCALAALVLWGCASTPAPTWSPTREGAHVHVVKPGDNLYRISKYYGTSVQAIARANRISDPSRLSTGQRLWIPEGYAPRSASTGGSVARSAGAFGAVDPRGRTAGKPAFIWPISGSISSRFGFRDGAHHDGVDIPAKKGTEIRAAEAGRVIHSDNTLAGYGNLVIIKHAGQLSTVYAHNRRNRVRQGQFVQKGEVIAEVGETGHATAPHLHFEVRANGSPRNPLGYLP